MFLNQILSVQNGRAQRALLIAGLVGALSVTGCSMFGRGESDPGSMHAGGTSSTATGSTPTAAEVQPTVTEALEALPDEGTATVIADTSEILNASAPRSYVVKRGDTLWGLARMFLRDPWLWPEIWYVNPQVQNPHLIYPGDTLALAQGSDGKSQLQITRGPLARLQPMLRSKAMDDNGPIATIPYDAIHAFLSRPGLMSKDEIKRAPYILSIRDGHLVAGTDHDVYVRKLHAGVGERFNVVHVAAPLRDPDGGKQLGYMTVYAGTVQVSRTGDPATANITESGREILSGDVLVSEAQPDTRNIVPHAPAQTVNGRVIGVVDGVSLVGQYAVVAINRGTRHGMDVGQVLRVRESDQSAPDRCARINGNSSCLKWRDTRLPNEAAGTLLVFKTLERLSYALVVTESNPIHLGDRVGNP
jgi:LysM repeat protein